MRRIYQHPQARKARIQAHRIACQGRALRRSQLVYIRQLHEFAEALDRGEEPDWWPGS